jgi:hypothetical protein
MVHNEGVFTDELFRMAPLMDCLHYICSDDKMKLGVDVLFLEEVEKVIGTDLLA